jgi:hypothetical protein
MDERRIDQLETEMADVKIRLAVAESNIKDIREDIRSIKDDTKWLRRAITNAIVGGIISGVIGGIIALIFAILKGGSGQ